MGDYSRDPVQRLADSAQKHYVGVRLQQGVPLLDADWNELEDLRKYEMSELVRRFIGDGVPDDNDGFRIEALAGGGVGTLVLQTDSSVAELTSIEIVLASSTAADRLGFLPGNTYSERFGSEPAQLTGNNAEPFALSDGLTFTVQINGGADQTVVFSAADFANIGQATATEVEAVLNTALGGVTVSVGTGNDFRIVGGGGTVDTAGRILVGGVEALIENHIMFQSQPLYQNTVLADAWGVDEIAPIAPVVADRQDLVYLDVWEREVGLEEDEAIIHAAVGVETAKRMRREWAVRVATGVSELSGVAMQSGHRYTVLSVVQRLLLEQNGITPLHLSDRRRTQINIARYLKTPVHVVQGTTVITVNHFAVVLETLQSILLQRYRNRVFPFTYDPVDTIGHNQNVVRQVIESILHYATFSAAQVRSGNYNNADALRVLTDLYAAQMDFVDVVTTFGDFDGEIETQAFISGYTTRLENAATGLGAMTTAGNLIASVAAQEEINSWLSLPIGALPEGSVIVSIDDVQPQTNVAFDVPFNITYRIESRVDSPQAQENFLISVQPVTATPWNFSLDTTQLVLTADGGIDEVVLTVTPRAGAATATFNLTAVAERNQAQINMTHTSPSFQIGLPPVAEDILQWIAPQLNNSGEIPFTQFMFQLGAGQVTVEIGLRNTSEEGLTQLYQLTHHVVPPVGQEASWLPAEASPDTQQVEVGGGEVETLILSITGPNPPAAGSEGTIVLHVTLLLEDSSLPTEPVDVQLEVAFTVS